MIAKLTSRSIYRVFRNRVMSSQHATEREAVCQAIRIKQEKPDMAVHVDHDLQIDVELEESND